MEEVVLCGASAYNKKFYLNEDFKGLPEQIKNELKIMCVLFTEDVGGIFSWCSAKRANWNSAPPAMKMICCTTRSAADLRSVSYSRQNRNCWKRCRCIIRFYMWEYRGYGR